MKHILFICVAVVAFGGSGLFTNLYYRTDDLSLRYNLWKAGVWPAPHNLAWAMVADNHGKYIVGMSKDEIIELFPSAHEGAANKYQADYEKWDIKGREHLWLNDQELIVFFEDGRAQGISLMKG